MHIYMYMHMSLMYLYMYVCRFQNAVLPCPTLRFHCFLSSHWPSFRFLSFIACLIPSIHFFFGLPRALFHAFDNAHKCPSVFCLAPLEF